MKILTSTLLVFIGYTNHAQSYQPFITPGKQFTLFLDEGLPSGTHTYHYFFKNDTTIKNKVYDKLWYYSVQDPNKNAYVCLLMREDTNAKIVYQYVLDAYPDSTYYNTEQVLYNFNLEAGDSILTRGYFPYQNSPWEWRKITTTSSMIIDGKSIKTFYTDVPDFFNNFMLFSESVPQGQLSPHYSLYSSQLKCAFKDRDTLIYGSCDLKNYIGLQEQFSSPEIKIYPNPATNFITVESEFNNGEIDFYNALGQRALHEVLNEKKQQISVAHLPAGIYYISINHADFVTSKKVVIQ